MERPTYDEETETLNRPGEKVHDVVERIWNLKEMLLIGIVKHETPVVYLGGAGESHNVVKTRDTRPPVPPPSEPRARGKAPSRPTDAFESAALAELRKGTELSASTTPAETRLVGAIRARADCIACHDGGVGALLGAFTYRLEPQSDAISPNDRLVDLADLAPDQRASIETIEAVGGTASCRDGEVQSTAGLEIKRCIAAKRSRTTIAKCVSAPFPRLKDTGCLRTKMTDAGGQATDR